VTLRRTRLKPGTKGLKTRTKLHASKPLERKTPLAQVSAKRLASGPPRPKLARPAVPPARRTTLAERSGGVCEIGLAGCVLVATQACHRITRKAGGRHGEAKERHDRLSDLLHGCWYCHALQTSPPKWLDPYALGISLKEHQIPTQKPVLYRGVPVYLTDDGQVLDYLEVGT
jgi:hypothetical protein